MKIVCPHCQAANRVPAERDGRTANCGKCGGKLFTGQPAALGLAAFDKQLAGSEIPVIVDFWAAWCGPCRQMGADLRTRRGGAGAARPLREGRCRRRTRARRALWHPRHPGALSVKGGKVAASHSGVADLSLLRSWAQKSA